MPPQTPLVLVDNFYDTVNLYPDASLIVTSQRTGHEGFRVADYRRERTSWQTTGTGGGASIAVDLGVGHTATCDYLFVDRGHNLWGATIGVEYSDNGSAWTQPVNRTFPAAGTLGGDPTSATLAVTEEGAAWTLFTAPSAHRYWRMYIGGAFVPAAVVTGLMLGLRNQLLGFSSSFDEDAGERTENTAVSTAGYRGTDTTYSWRTCELSLALIGATEYDAAIRALREKLFKRNQPWVCAMDYGTHPERAWLYQYDGKSWSFGKKRVHREGRIRGREVGQALS